MRLGNREKTERFQSFLMSSFCTVAQRSRKSPKRSRLRETWALTTTMASSQRDAYTYESQNDQRLDELHSKIRTLRGVTTDIHDDVERQNLMLDDTSNSFTAFASSLSQSTRNFTRAFGGTKTWRIMLYVCGGIIGLWILSKLFGMFWYS